jgi:hypothetical protein
VCWWEASDLGGVAGWECFVMLCIFLCTGLFPYMSHKNHCLINIH